MAFLIFQIPFCVIVGWMMGQPMDLNFQLFETATLFVTVLVVAFMLQVCHLLSSVYYYFLIKFDCCETWIKSFSDCMVLMDLW